MKDLSVVYGIAYCVAMLAVILLLIFGKDDWF